MTKEEILDALRYIHGQLNSNFIDLGSGSQDYLELDIIRAAIREFEINHHLTEFDILKDS